MTPKIEELIDKQDNFEIISAKIASILTIESANQQQLAIAASKDPLLWELRVFSERSNAIEEFRDKPVNKSPIVNVAYDSSNFDPSASEIVKKQQGQAIFNIDCYGYAVASDNPSGGHNPGDVKAALTTHRAIRLVRNILMSSQYRYLDLRGLVGLRWPQSINMYRQQLGASEAQQVIAGRITLSVTYFEISPQEKQNILELIKVEVITLDNGQVVLNADYDTT